MEKIERARNSQLAREVEIALPVELDREKQIQLVRDYVTENFVSAGMCADIAIHDKENGNPHAHIMLTMRPLAESGEWGAKSRKEYILDKNGQRVKSKNGTFKTRKINTVDWNDKEKAEVWRKAWADVTNRYFAEQNRLLTEMRHQISRLTIWIRQMTGQRTSFYQSYPIKSESITYFAGLSEQSHAGKQRSTEQLWESEGFKGICKSSQFLTWERDCNACTVARYCIRDKEALPGHK